MAFLDKQGTCPNTKTQVFTVGASNEGLVRWISFHNYSDDDRTVTWYSKQSTSLQMDTFLLPSGKTIERSFPYPLHYLTGEGIEVQADLTNSVNYKIVGEENAV
jgi:hypothetical protein